MKWQTIVDVRNKNKIIDVPKRYGPIVLEWYRGFMSRPLELVDTQISEWHVHGGLPDTKAETMVGQHKEISLLKHMAECDRRMYKTFNTYLRNTSLESKFPLRDNPFESYNYLDDRYPVPYHIFPLFPERPLSHFETRFNISAFQYYCWMWFENK